MTAPIDFKQIETELIDDFFSGMQQQADAQPRQIQPPDRPGPYHVTPQHLIERQQIEEQLHMLIDVSVAHLYQLLQARFDEVKQAQQTAIELERTRLSEQRAWQEKQERMTVTSMCEPSRPARYTY